MKYAKWSARHAVQSNKTTCQHCIVLPVAGHQNTFGPVSRDLGTYYEAISNQSDTACKRHPEVGASSYCLVFASPLLAGWGGGVLQPCNFRDETRLAHPGNILTCESGIRKHVVLRVQVPPQTRDKYNSDPQGVGIMGEALLMEDFGHGQSGAGRKREGGRETKSSEGRGYA